jgi:CubicO group peptidase (beta-lactamase class C family)
MQSSSKSIEWACAIALSVLMAGIPLASLAGPADPFAVALEERMPALLQRYRAPGAVVSCIRDGEVVWTKAFGLANMATGAPMQTNLVFNHGSDGKALTAWGIMRLVEQGKVSLDAPANRYLKRWQVRPSKFDPNEVTIRRLLSHSAGLSVHGFLDYNRRRRLPSLVDMLEGKYQPEMLNEVNGPVFIKWQPGAQAHYSGGGFVLLQMVIEDVTGEPFAAFMHREVTAPLGISRLAWVWTPQLEAEAPIPYGEYEEPVGYRQLGCQAIGSELCSVPDFARFVAGAVPGPHGEPPGRGVLKPESLAQMLEPQPGTDDTGLGYGIGNINGDKVVSHSGANVGWNARFFLDVNRREGFVVAVNSMPGGPLIYAVQNIWMKSVLGIDGRADPPLAEDITVPVNRLVLKWALGFGALLFVAACWCVYQVFRGRRRRQRSFRKLPILLMSPSVLAALLWWYWFYAPQAFPLPVSPTWPDLWVLPLVNYVMTVLVSWVGVSFLFVLFPRKR